MSVLVSGNKIQIIGLQSLEVFNITISYNLWTILKPCFGLLSWVTWVCFMNIIIFLVLSFSLVCVVCSVTYTWKEHSEVAFEHLWILNFMVYAIRIPEKGSTVTETSWTGKNTAHCSKCNHRRSKERCFLYSKVICSGDFSRYAFSH